VIWAIVAISRKGGQGPTPPPGAGAPPPPTAGQPPGPPPA
jgi:collagen type III alpha